MILRVKFTRENILIQKGNGEKCIKIHANLSVQRKFNLKCCKIIFCIEKFVCSSARKTFSHRLIAAYISLENQRKTIHKTANESL